MCGFHPQGTGALPVTGSPMWSKSMIRGFHPREAGAFPVIGSQYSLLSKIVDFPSIETSAILVTDSSCSSMVEQCFDTASTQVRFLSGARVETLL